MSKDDNTLFDSWNNIKKKIEEKPKIPFHIRPKRFIEKIWKISNDDLLEIKKELKQMLL